VRIEVLRVMVWMVLVYNRLVIPAAGAAVAVAAAVATTGTAPDDAPIGNGLLF
jgi:hypothetical protein